MVCVKDNEYKHRQADQNQFTVWLLTNIFIFLLMLHVLRDGFFVICDNTSFNDINLIHCL